jgi:DMSO reductase family type II enzyme chaperone
LATPIETASSSPDTAQAFAAAYLLLGRAFAFPTAAVHADLQGDLQEAMARAVDSLPVALNGRRLPEVSLSPEKLEISYLAAFEVGDGERPPCPLYEGFHRANKSRHDILQELLRFYDCFGVRLKEGERDFPDHLITELEFLAALSQAEAAALGAGGDPVPFRRASADFLERHLTAWAPALHAKIAEKSLGEWYEAASSLIARLAAKHLAHLRLREEAA